MAITDLLASFVKAYNEKDAKIIKRAPFVITWGAAPPASFVLSCSPRIAQELSRSLSCSARGASRPNATMWLVASCSSGKSQRSGAHRLHSPASVLEPGCAAVMLDSVF